jgi:hypothetical protein
MALTVRVLAAVALFALSAFAWLFVLDLPTPRLWLVFLPLVGISAASVVLYLRTEWTSAGRVWALTTTTVLVIPGVLWVRLSPLVLFGYVVLVVVVLRVYELASVAHRTGLQPVGIDAPALGVVAFLRSVGRVLAWGTVALAISLFSLNVAVVARFLFNRSETVFLLALLLLALIAVLAAGPTGGLPAFAAWLRRLGRSKWLRGRT